MTAAPRTTLVLGGGGVAGIAWMTGLLAGVADAGLDLRTAETVIGTSAGSTVGAQLTSGLGFEELFARQADPALQADEIAVEFDAESFLGKWAAVAAESASPADMRRRAGALALAAETVPEAERRAVIASRLPVHQWPVRQRLLIVAVDAESGEPLVLDRECGVPLVDAVAASCAVPMVWPPATVDGGRRCIDGGILSNDNAQLALGTGAERVLIVLPLPPEVMPRALGPFEDVVAALRKEGARVAVIVPDAASTEAIGSNPLDPGTRTPAAHAGRAQGRATRLDWS
jgi:NTE family protein